MNFLKSRDTHDAPQMEMLRQPVESNQEPMTQGEEAIKAMRDKKEEQFLIPPDSVQDRMFWVGVANTLSTEGSHAKNEEQKQACRAAEIEARRIMDAIKKDPATKVDVSIIRLLLESAFSTHH